MLPAIPRLHSRRAVLSQWNGIPKIMLGADMILSPLEQVFGVLNQDKLSTSHGTDLHTFNICSGFDQK